MTNKEKPRAHMEEWTIVNNHLYGKVSHHPRQETFSANVQKTSAIVSCYINGTRKEVETLNTIYTFSDGVGMDGLSPFSGSITLTQE